jgi:hypothetical protein
MSSILTLGTLLVALASPLQAVTTLEEDLLKVRTKHAIKAKKEALKKEHKKAMAELKAKQKLELLRLETSIATEQAEKVQ